MFDRIINRLLSESGASMVEYAILVMLIAILGFVAVEFFGNSVADTYSTIADEMVNAGS